MTFLLCAIPPEQAFYNEGRSFVRTFLSNWRMSKQERKMIANNIFPEQLQIMVDLLKNPIKFEITGERDISLVIKSEIIKSFQLSLQIVDNISTKEFYIGLEQCKAQVNFRHGVIRYLKPWLRSRKILTDLQGNL